MIKPILFNTEMVRAILEGRKTVTRRDPFQMPPNYDVLKGMYRGTRGLLCAVFQCSEDPTTEAIYSRFDRGDVLWVRETWNRAETGEYLYKADNEKPLSYLGWCLSIHMPKEAARLFLRVTMVRVERLREMVLGDVLMEGVQETDIYENTWDLWHQTWDSTIKPADRPLYGWKANPWVWVIQFERCEKPEEF